jgi:uncharacterized protein YutE (UPF0331/DUF86 family)
MVISSLNTTRILELIRFIETCLNELKPFSKMTKKKFLSDRKNPPFVESYLRRSLEAVFDIGRHILAKTQGFKEIEYKTIAKELGERGIISKELSDSLYVMAGYRNRRWWVSLNFFPIAMLERLCYYKAWLKRRKGSDLLI